MDTDLSVERIEEAATVIDPVFMNTPQYADEQLNAALGRHVTVKVETANPLRSFKGRGAELFMRGIEPRRTVVCSSTGNFGQAIAWAGRRRGNPVEVFVPAGISPAKIERMRLFGATVTPKGADSAEAEAAARERAEALAGSMYVEDGRETSIAEGAGTIGIELLKAGPFDAIVIPVGDGALITGVACWVKHHSPATRIIGVCAERAPSLALSWREGRPVSTDRADTIAEGIQVREPVPESVARLRVLVDDMLLIADDDLLKGMALALRTLGLVLEPAGAAGLAAIMRHEIAGERIATLLTGSNVRPEHLRAVAH